MGKRGPKKGTCYTQNGTTDEVKIVLHRHNYPNATWTDTTKLIHNNSEKLIYSEFKDRKIKPVKRSYKKFENVFSNLGLAKAKEWEKLINGVRITNAFWQCFPEGKEQFRITFNNSGWCYVFPKNDLVAKWNDMSNFLQEGTIAGWMIDNANFNEKVLLDALKKWKYAEKIRKEILDLRGDEHLSVVSIGSDKAELATKKQIFKKLEDQHKQVMESIFAQVDSKLDKSDN